MFYFDPILIDAMARERLSRRGQLINLDMNDYRMFASEREVICAGSVDEPAEVLIHLLVHPGADVTMENYSLLGRTIEELFGDDIRLKIGFASDESLPSNQKDIMVFVAGN